MGKNVNFYICIFFFSIPAKGLHPQPFLDVREEGCASGVRVNRFLDKNAINNNFKVNNCHITTNRQIASTK